MHGLARQILLACLLLPALVLAVGRACAAPDIIYVYPDQSVWTTETDQHGNPANPLLRLAKSLFAQTGLNWREEALPAARMFSSLKSGEANFSMLVKAPALQECCLFSRQPVAGTELRVNWRQGTAPIMKREDLAGKSLLVILGYSYGDMAAFLADGKNAIHRTSAVKHQAAFEMLAQGRGDYLLDYAGPAREVLAARPIPDIQSAVLGRMDVHLVLSRQYPDAEGVMNRLEAAAMKFGPVE